MQTQPLPWPEGRTGDAARNGAQEIGDGIRDQLDADGRNLSEKGFDAFPPSLRPLVLAIRRMPHADYVWLVRYCKGWTVKADLEEKVQSSAHLRTVIDHLKQYGTIDDKNVKHDLLRLTRTERPDDGYSILEGQAIKGYGIQNPLTININMVNGKTYKLTVKPLETDVSSSIVEVDGGEKKKISNGRYLTIGRTDLTLQDIFGMLLLKEKNLKTDLTIATGDQQMSRSCIKIGRSPSGLVQVLECGAANVVSIDVYEQKPTGERVTDASLSLRTGMTQLFHNQPLNWNAIESV